MNKSPRMQKRWAWIMGAITLVIALFLPPVWSFGRGDGFYWQLRDLAPASSLSQVILHTDLINLLILLFPPCILIACTILLWSRQLPWTLTIFRGMLVTLEATGIALLVTAVFYLVIFIIPGLVLGNRVAMGWGVAFTMYNTLWAGLAFLTFLPCLLVVALVLACLQRKHIASSAHGDGAG